MGQYGYGTGTSVHGAATKSLMANLVFHQVLYLNNFTHHYDIVIVFPCLYLRLIQYLLLCIFCSFMKLFTFTYPTCIFSCYFQVPCLFLYALILCAP